MLFRRVCSKLREFGHREGNIRTGSQHEVEQGTNYGLEPTSYLRVCLPFQFYWNIPGRERSSGSLGVLHTTTLQHSFEVGGLVNVDLLTIPDYAHAEELRQLS